MKLKVLVQQESIGGFSVSIPALPGCYSEGETLEQALVNIREAAELWLDVTDERARTLSQLSKPEFALQEIEL